MDKNTITIEAVVNAPIEKVWEYWTKPEHITKWAFASDDWTAPFSENNLKKGGKFKTRMEAKNKSEGFDFGGVYTDIIENKLIEYDMDDKRHVKTQFEETLKGVKITQSFDMENENPKEVQKKGWQAILNNFKKYTQEN